MFLAARSLWTNALRCRYSIPQAMSLQNPSSVNCVSSGTIDPGLWGCEETLNGLDGGMPNGVLTVAAG